MQADTLNQNTKEDIAQNQNEHFVSIAEYILERCENKEEAYKLLPFFRVLVQNNGIMR